MRNFPLLKLAGISFRNIFRNKRRTGLLLLILAAGSSALILVGGFLDDLMVHMREDFIHTQNGHIQISQPGFVEGGISAPLDYLIEDYSKVAKLVQGEHVAHVIPRLKLRGMASAGRASLAVQLIGVDPELETYMGGYRHTKRSDKSFQITSGRDLNGTDLNSAVLGGALLKNLYLQVNGSVNFISMRKAGALDGGDYAVVGSFQTFMKAFDERTMMIPLQSAQSIIGKPDAVNSILLLLDRTDRTDAIVERIRAILKEHHLPFEVIPWHQQADY